jgi:hypothetical protein
MNSLSSWVEIILWVDSESTLSLEDENRPTSRKVTEFWNLEKDKDQEHSNPKNKFLNFPKIK